MTGSSDALRTLVGSTTVIPVLTIDDARYAVDLGRALVEGGLRVLEITLRTNAGLAAIREIAQALPDAIVGAGTVLHARQADEAAMAGAKFIVSPGTTRSLINAVNSTGVPFLPGCATASEAMLLAEEGITFAKFFPAEPAGGAAYLKALGEPLRDLAFCPTGGIDLAKAKTYLALGNVVCVGGSWVAPKAAIANGDWATVTKLAREAAGLRG
jgi:2-dehydro-3-deoxyphosphogluconate aldolase/(4S)-4-hydroxy-2-oxoglutarate aldolase